MKKLTFIIALLFCSIVIGQEKNLKNKLYNGIVYGKDTIVMIKSIGNNLRVTTNKKTVLYRSITTPIVKNINGSKAIVYKLHNGKAIVKEDKTIITVDNTKTVYKN